ncbi:MAG TPA: hypothetical protein DEF47_23020 [Herpetosiphon sp.]|uniref:Uncharacterized protein n=1 Tax=Herpetosiphon aurantiacus (strain ATCC 23779 / DSM 785 / 114-95) TaxID=316274 RepID=A9B2G8_HERA2|nr:hypothetical protein [Herpetosiphon sp.]ABX04013.1 hypothetical protein Haur_1368 [Herpetosiphon aurantiacus DSM 785]HBW52763.1 hypothetical protein [Herpetosiphon sp.]
MTTMQLLRNGSVVIDFMPAGVNPTEGTTCYWLVDGSWQPQVPQRDRRLISNGEQFQPSVQSFAVNIFGGTNEDQAWAAYHALMVLLDDAERFYEEGYSSAVVWRTKPSDTTVHSDMLVMGRAGDTPMVGTSPTLIQDNDVWWILNVPVTFLCRPLRCAASSVSSSTSASANIATIHQPNFSGSAAPLESPTNLTLNVAAATNGATISGLIAVAPRGKMVKSAAWLFAPSPSVFGWSRQIQASGVYATDNLVCFYNFPSVTPSYSPNGVLTDIGPLNSRSVIQWAMLKTTAPFLITPVVRSNGALIEGRATLVDSATPIIVPLGQTSAPYLITGHQLKLTNLTNAGAIYINAILTIAADAGGWSVIPFASLPLPSTTTTITVDARYLSNPDASLTYTSAGVTQAVPTDSNPLALTKDLQLDVNLFAVNGNAWSATTENAASARTMTVQASRLNGAIIPL